MKFIKEKEVHRSDCGKFFICKNHKNNKYYINYRFEINGWLYLMDKNFKKSVKFDDFSYFETEKEAEKFCERAGKVLILK